MGNVITKESLVERNRQLRVADVEKMVASRQRNQFLKICAMQ